MTRKNNYLLLTHQYQKMKLSQTSDERHPVRQMAGLAKQIALPGEYTPTRLPSFPAMERTAVLGFNVPRTYTVDSGNVMLLTRQAAYPLWAHTTAFFGASCDAYIHTYGTNTVSFNTTTRSATISPSLRSWTASNITAGTGVVGLQGSANSAVGNYPVVGQDAETGPVPWTYVPVNAGFGFIAHNDGTGTIVPATNEQIQVVCEIWAAPGETKSLSPYTFTWAAGFAGAASAAALGSAIPGGAPKQGAWIRPTMVSIAGTATDVNFNRLSIAIVYGGSYTVTLSATVPGTVNVGTATNSPVFAPITHLKEFGHSPMPWYSTRVTAVGLLGTNVTPTREKSGTILCGRLPPAVTYGGPWGVDETDLESLHPAEKDWLALETGVYTYAPPSTDLSTFYDYTLSTAAGAAPSPAYRLDNPSMCNFMVFRPSGVSETLALTLSFHIEFRTSSSLFPIGISDLSLETLHKAQLALVTTGFFFENPEHKSVLTRLAMAVNTLAHNMYGPPKGTIPMALAAAKMVSPSVGSAATAAYSTYQVAKAVKGAYEQYKKTRKRKAKQPTQPHGDVLVKPARIQMPTTSLVRSGEIVPRKR